MVRAPRGNFRVESESHRRSRFRFALHRQFRRTAFRRRQLIFPAVRHENRPSADRRIELFHQTALTANVELFEIVEPVRPYIARKTSTRIIPDRRNSNAGVLPDAVGVQKIAADIYNFAAAPAHNQRIFIRYLGDNVRLHVFRVRVLQKFRQIFRRQHDRHAFLRFGNCQLGAVKPLVLFAHGVQINIEPVRQFADRYSHAARAEIVAALNQPTDFRVSEQPLDFPLGKRIALLNFRAAGFNRFDGVHLAGAGSAANPVAPSSTADEQNQIARLRLTAHDIFSGRRAYNRANFHTLGKVAFVVNFANLPRRQTNLVAVGAETLRRFGGDKFLRELAWESFGKRSSRVSRAGYAQCLINVNPAGKRVANGAA